MGLQTGRKYERTGYLAIAPGALSSIFASLGAADTPEISGRCAIVRVSGPLDHHADGWFDSYDAIVSRVRAACSTQVDTVLISLDSPGGQVSGMVDAAREIRSVAAAAGKRLVAHVTCACSAAYALASACNEIYVSSTGIAGSIGVIEARLDAHQQDAAMGLRLALITSGARKADGHPSQELTGEELAAKQTVVDALAEEFFSLVSENRKVPVESVRSLEASVFAGNAAKMKGLADGVMSFSELLAKLNGEGSKMEKDDLIEALRALAECDDEDLKARAAKALAAMTEDAPAEETPPEEEKKEEASAVSTAGAMAVVAQGALARLAAVEAKLEAAERSSLLASRPDVDDTLKAALASSPVSEVRRILGAIKRPAAPKPAASTVVAPTRGDAQGTSVARLSADAKLALDARMGLATAKSGPIVTDHKLTLGAMTVAPKTGGSNG